MQRAYFIALVFFAIANVASTQVIDVMHVKRTGRLPITPYAAILRTKEILPIDSIVKNHHFSKSENEPVLIYEYDPFYYCFRFIVNNRSSSAQDLMLLMAPVGIRDSKLYKRVNNKWQDVAHTGLSYKFEERTYQFTHHVFPFSIAANKIDTIYLQTDATNVFKSFGFAILPPKSLKIFENRIYFIFGIIEGLLILFFFLNISLFCALKERIHLWYALYISLLFLIVMKNDHLEQQFLGFDSEFHYRILPYMSVGALAIAVLMHVVHSFFKKDISKSKWLVRTSNIFKLIVLISAFCHFIAFNVSPSHITLNIVYSFAKNSTLLGMLMIMIICIYSFRKGNAGGLIIFCGTAVFMIGSAQRLIFPSTLSFLFPPTTFHVGIVVETLIISIGLIWRYWNEKEMHRKREKDIQAQTMHDISQEIHDNVGQTLTLAKYNLYGIDLDKNSASEKLTDTVNLIGKALSDLRDLSRNLKGGHRHKECLTEQIKSELEQVSKTGAFKITFQVKGNAFELEQNKVSIIIRIVKEVLHNIIKHSQASEVEVALNFTTNVFMIMISDNGVGFEMDVVKHQSNGLQNIKNRCKVLNAKHQIETLHGAGTRITITMPVSQMLNGERAFELSN